MSKKTWPEWKDLGIDKRFPENSLMAGAESEVWKALQHVDPSMFKNTGKQIVVRKALERIGLEWVATNTTPFRIMVGALFDAAKECHDEAGSSKSSNSNAGKKDAEGETFSFDFVRHKLAEPKDAITGPILDRSFNEDDYQTLWGNIEKNGACVIRGALDPEELSDFPGLDQLVTEQGNETKLSESQGNGISGEPPAYYADVTEAPEWYAPFMRQLERLLVDPNQNENKRIDDVFTERKSILLAGGQTSENWAHQDNNDKYPPLQAILMLSNPGKDFKGGEFYVAKQEKSSDNKTTTIERYEVEFHSAGDLVVFQAGKNSGWWHGMLPVRKGDEEKEEKAYLRKALGMLQPDV